MLALRVLTALSEALPRQNGQQALSPEALEFMADGLASLPADALRRAAAAARDTLRFFPTVAELRELAGCAAAKPEDGAAAEALAAWDRTRRWCVRNGQSNPHTGVIEMPDAGVEVGGQLPARCLHALRLAGGINRVVCSRDTDEEKWCKRDFCESYRLAPAVEEADSRALPGRGDVAALAEGLAARLALVAAPTAKGAR